jgi:arylsulfatase A-like enzyme
LANAASLLYPDSMATMLRALLFAFLFAATPATQSPPQSNTRPPNIVYVLADELGYYELSCLGHPHIQTPNIDRMAEEGMRFTQYLAGSAVCAPTRACLMTGKHSGHTSVRSNGGGTPLRQDEVTVANLLQARGYATGGFGKWGCGGRGSTGVPEAHGFDTFVGYYDQVHAHSYYPAYIIENSKELPLAGNQGGRAGQTYSHNVIVERAMQFVRDHKDQPFFCYMPVTPPHGLFDIPDDDPAWKLYQDKPWPVDARRYAAMVTMLDRQVGELLDLLKELELDDNTIVLFSGDNGGADYFRSKEHPRGFHGANVHPATGVEFRGKKGQLFEGGLRIPMVARWPGQIAAGTVSDHLCYFPDFLPTAAELAGAAQPADIDGISMLGALLGKTQRTHDHLYWEIGNQVAVRHGKWKALRRGKQQWELFDLEADISEANDIAASNAEVLAKLVAMADKSHELVREGTFASRELHEKDRRAKYGKNAPKPNRRRNKAKHRLPTKGMLANDKWKVVRVSSESTSNGKLAANVIDHDPNTIWHSNWSGTVNEHPHELVIDLGERTTIHGLCYLARQDNGWNGSIGTCEFSVSDDPQLFVQVAAKATLKETREPQRMPCPPVTGRYVRLRILTEIHGGPWASVADLGVMLK